MQKSISILVLSFCSYILLENHFSSESLFINQLDSIPFKFTLGHCLLMGVSCFFVNILLKKKKMILFSNQFLVGSLLMIVVSTIDEVSQIFIVGRYFEVSDLLSNYFGIFIFNKILK